MIESKTRFRTLLPLSALLLTMHCSGNGDEGSGDGDGDGDGDTVAGTGGDGSGAAGTGGDGAGAADTGGAGAADSGGADMGTGGTDPGTTRRVCDGTQPTGIKLTEVAAGLNAPTFVISDPNDASRLFVTEKGGTVKLLGTDTPLATIAVDTDSEAGVLSMAFHPDFGTGGETRVFVSYTAPNTNNEIQVYDLVGDTMTAIGGPIYSSDQAQSNHNGGDIAFGPDGYLYLSIGDGGVQNDGDGHAQDLTIAMGSIVRLDVDNLGTPPPGNIPDENGNDTNIFHWGFRNPWRMSFDSATGDLYIADVGQGAREEVSVVQPGTPSSNFGWPALEGSIPCGACNTNKPPITDDMIRPFYEHDHSDGNVSITGGYVYRGTKIPSLVGRYLLSDYGSNNIYTFTYDGTTGCDTFEITDEVDPDGVLNGVSSFGQDADGELYIVSINSGTIHRIDPE